MIGNFSPARVFARSFMPTYIARGYSSRDIQRDLISRFGEAYRMQNIQSDMRFVTGLGKKQKMIERADVEAPITRSAMIETNLGQPYKYRIHADITLLNTSTDEIFTKRVSFFDDINRGVLEWQEAFVDTYSQYGYEEDWLVTDVEIKQIDHDRRLPY